MNDIFELERKFRDGIEITDSEFLASPDKYRILFLASKENPKTMQSLASYLNLLNTEELKTEILRIINDPILSVHAAESISQILDSLDEEKKADLIKSSDDKKLSLIGEIILLGQKGEDVVRVILKYSAPNTLDLEIALKKSSDSLLIEFCNKEASFRQKLNNHVKKLVEKGSYERVVKFAKIGLLEFQNTSSSSKLNELIDKINNIDKILIDYFRNNKKLEVNELVSFLEKHTSLTPEKKDELRDIINNELSKVNSARANMSIFMRIRNYLFGSEVEKLASKIISAHVFVTAKEEKLDQHSKVASLDPYSIVQLLFQELTAGKFDDFKARIKSLKKEDKTHAGFIELRAYKEAMKSLDVILKSGNLESINYLFSVNKEDFLEKVIEIIKTSPAEDVKEYLTNISRMESYDKVLFSGLLNILAENRHEKDMLRHAIDVLNIDVKSKSTADAVDTAFKVGNTSFLSEISKKGYDIRTIPKDAADEAIIKAAQKGAVVPKRKSLLKFISMRDKMQRVVIEHFNKNQSVDGLSEKLAYFAGFEGEDKKSFIKSMDKKIRKSYDEKISEAKEKRPFLLKLFSSITKEEEIAFGSISAKAAKKYEQIRENKNLR